MSEEQENEFVKVMMRSEARYQVVEKIPCLAARESQIAPKLQLRILSRCSCNERIIIILSLLQQKKKERKREKEKYKEIYKQQESGN